ncbi:hypothetical protein, partial [Pantoea ananatis]|uniref:hypothetical protein n=1 Tax=Pantoea ananas TaxID=553 RepID=UPI0018B01211
TLETVLVLPAQVDLLAKNTTFYFHHGEAGYVKFIITDNDIFDIITTCLNKCEISHLLPLHYEDTGLTYSTFTINASRSTCAGSTKTVSNVTILAASTAIA